MWKSQILKNIFFFEMGWADPAQQHGLSPARVNSVLNCSHATWKMEAWQGQQRLQRRLTCGGVEAVLLAVVVATALLEARWRATGFFLFAVQRREPLFFLFVFFFSSARRAAAAGVDREEAQRWRCWAEGGRPPPCPCPRLLLRFFSLSSSFLVLLFSFFFTTLLRTF